MNEESKKQKSQLTANIIATLSICIIFVSLLMLFSIIIYPKLLSVNTTLLIVLTVIMGIIFFVAGCMIILRIDSTAKATVPDELKKYKTFAKFTQIVIVATTFIVSVFIFYNSFIGKSGYIRGDYSEYKCQDCGKPANGGYIPAVNGYDAVYFCKEHFEENKKRFDESKNTDPTKDAFGNEEFDAFWDAKCEVEKQLKSPSTAKFCSSHEAEIIRNGNTWSVEGWVDAQNSFGATLRNEFVVKITYTAKDTYNVEYCKIK